MTDALLDVARMRTRIPRPRSVVALLVLLALPAADGFASSDLGSAVSGDGLGSMRDRDDRGASLVLDAPPRTPTGYLYPAPYLPLAYRGDEIRIRAFAEFGYLDNVGDEDEARFEEYADWSDGFLLRNFTLDARQRDGAGYLDLGGGAVGRDDQFYFLEVGQFGLVRLRGEYDALPHVYSDDARVLFEKQGQESLVLPPGLTPGESTAGEIATALSTVGESRLLQQRDETGFDLSLRLLPGLTLAADYRLTRRDGQRPFGGTLGLTFGSTNAGSVIETLEPIHSRTHDWSAGLAWATPDVQANLAYRGSFFDNGRSSLTWENPFPAVDLGFLLVPGQPRGRSALAPDNQLHQLAADVGVALPLDGRFTASGVWTTMRQDQKLLPATINPAISDFATLARDRADARVDQITIRSLVRLRPVRPVRLQLRVGYFERSSDTRYFSFDPTTGEFGYVVEDLAPANRVGAPSFDSERWEVEGGARWTFAKHSQLGLEVEHEATRRTNRSRKEVDDDRVRLHLSTRALPSGTLRLAYEFERRRGSGYDTSRDHVYYAAAPLSGEPAGPERSLLEFRQFDLASRDRHDVQLRSNWMIGERADASLIGRYRTTDFRADYGVTGEEGAEFTAETGYQLSPRFNAHAFVSFAWRRRRMDSINAAPGAGVDFSAGGPVFPFDNLWRSDSDTRTVAFGAGLEARPFDRVFVDASYRYLQTRESVDTGFDDTGGALSPVIDPMTARRGFPALLSSDHVLDISGRYRLVEDVDTRVFYRLVHSTLDDYHQEGLVPLINQNLYLANIDNDYTAHIVGISVILRY